MFNKKMLLVFSLLCAHGFAFGGQIEDKHEFLKSNAETLKELKNRCGAMKKCELTRQTTSEAIKLFADLQEFQNKIDAAKPAFANAYIQMNGISMDSLIYGAKSNLSELSSSVDSMIRRFSWGRELLTHDLRIKKSVDVEAWNQVTTELEAAADELKEIKGIFAGIADDELRNDIQKSFNSAEERINKEIDFAKSTLLACQQAALPTPPSAPNINSDATPKEDGVPVTDQALPKDDSKFPKFDQEDKDCIALLETVRDEYIKFEIEVEDLSIFHPVKLWDIKKAIEKRKTEFLNAHEDGQMRFENVLEAPYNRIVETVMYKLKLGAAVFAAGTGAAVAAGYAAYKKWVANNELEQVVELEAV